MSAIRSTSTRAALLALPLVIGLLGTAAAPAGATPRHPAESLTCRGKGVDPDARIRQKTETVIHAPLSTIWKLQTDVERWPSWQSPVETAERLDHGPLRQGSAFRWATPAPATPTTPATTLEITSTVEQLKRNSCIRWTGPAIGDGLRIDRGVHVWNFTKVDGGVRVSTEETHRGAQVESNVPLATEILRRGLEQWLSELKAAAEACAHGRTH
ncbi:polyketide cyclase /reductase [Streptomyces albofaciens JCM 4342]|uniref:SRPBCC family protein n=1 Tax=Streptomyces albofaciens TaxID=66866 RepID=UPI00123B0515|nr:SRPBCC family protein [Streptomyces albofaciens]KAA6212131.1 polyketide cyclase /reductase [Streptomyces albofaciens JCM 4342]